jgi:glycosyltransferase involved in cell wall biosynthesis
MNDTIPLSVAIIAFNEADRIAGLLESLAFAEDVVVVDSGSRDDTVAIARQHGARVIDQAFLGFGPQKQVAVDHCRHDWVLLVDADERVPQETAAAIRQAIQDAHEGVAAFEIRRRNFLHGRWIRHCGWWPDRIVRLVRRSRGRFSDDRVHERWVTDGPVAFLAVAIDHHSFRDYADMLDKLQYYSTLGAEQMAARGVRGSAWSAVSHGCWTFVQVYGLKRGFLDGFDGLVIALLNAGGAFMKYAKCRERHITSTPYETG